MPPIRKKQAQPQSTTLHTFFSKPKPARKTKRKSTPLAPRPQEVIDLVDSEDSEDEGEPAKPLPEETRHRKDSPPLEIVAVNKNASFSFGTPCFDAPPPSKPPDVSLASDELPEFVQGSSSNVWDNGLIDETQYTERDQDGDWKMEDDEIVTYPVEEESQSAPASVDQECPLCGKDMGGSEFEDFQRHVTACVDEMEIVESPVVKPKEAVVPKRSPKVTTSSVNSAFSVLMASNADDAAWKEADAADNRPGRLSNNKGSGNRRKAPFYKVLQGMPIAVDAFCYGKIPKVTAYFLTHAHSDHYTNLSSNWKHGPIYASEATCNLIVHMLGVDKKWICPLPFNVPTPVPNTDGVQVTLIEANHCPGSCLFFFEGKQTIDAGDSIYTSPHVGGTKIWRYLHCGDFRACPEHVLHPQVKGKRIDHVYLDTTYLDPKYTFPPQPLVIDACADLAQKINAGCKAPSTPAASSIASWAGQAQPATPKPDLTKPERVLFVVGTYSIGKERIVKAVAKAVDSKVYCDARKADILRCQPDSELHDLLTVEPLAAQVHILPLGMISSDKLAMYAERFKGAFTKVVGFRPTGWTFTPATGSAFDISISSIISKCQSRRYTSANLQPSRQSTTALQLYPVPYSEHSSFFELTAFALSLDGGWGKMIATVNVGSEASRKKMAKWVERWEKERKRREGKAVEPRDATYW